MGFSANHLLAEMKLRTALANKLRHDCLYSVDDVRVFSVLIYQLTEIRKRKETVNLYTRSIKDLYTECQALGKFISIKTGHFH